MTRKEVTRRGCSKCWNSQIRKSDQEVLHKIKLCVSKHMYVHPWIGSYDLPQIVDGKSRSKQTFASTGYPLLGIYRHRFMGKFTLYVPQVTRKCELAEKIAI